MKQNITARIVLIIYFAYFWNAVVIQGQAASNSGSDKLPHLEIPGFGAAKSGSNYGKYTGYNSLNMQEIYLVEKKAAIRAQIARGWGKPIIVRLPSGDLLASQYRDLVEQRPINDKVVFDTAICRSTDDGFSWSEPKLLGLKGKFVQFSCLRSGTLIMATGYNEHAALYRSIDEGLTWSSCKVYWNGKIDLPGHSTFLFEETAGVTELPDGTLIINGAIETGQNATSYILRSRDDGKTWGDATAVPTGSVAVEISYVVLPAGKLMGFARTRTGGFGEGGAALKIIESSDGGYHWSTPRDFGLGMAQIPGFPLYLKDGRLILVYGNRQFPFGAQAIASRDLGHTWDTHHPIILSWFSWGMPCGLPRSLVMPDGSIMTGYYARIFDSSPREEEDVVSHALRWQVPSDWPKM